jgi:hypothetical protein
MISGDPLHLLGELLQLGAILLVGGGDVQRQQMS